MIHLPKYLTDPIPKGHGFTEVEKLPILDFVESLAEIGYRLTQDHGEIRAVPIDPCNHLSYPYAGAFKCYYCGEVTELEEV